MAHTFNPGTAEAGGFLCVVDILVYLASSGQPRLHTKTMPHKAKQSMETDSCGQCGPQQVKVPAIKSEDLSLTSGTHTVGGLGDPIPTSCSLVSVGTL